MKLSCALCIISYLCISLIPGSAVRTCRLRDLWIFRWNPLAWYVQQSIRCIKRGGTVMFALLALAGDLGCSGGPTLVGFVSSAFENNLRIGIFVGILFPVVIAAGIDICRQKEGEEVRIRISFIIKFFS